jgi:DNA repair protein RadC
MTQLIKQSGELLGIKFLDHVLLGEYSYYSFETNETRDWSELQCA